MCVVDNVRWATVCHLLFQYWRALRGSNTLEWWTQRSWSRADHQSWRRWRRSIDRWLRGRHRPWGPRSASRGCWGQGTWRARAPALVQTNLHKAYLRQRRNPSCLQLRFWTWNDVSSYLLIDTAQVSLCFILKGHVCDGNGCVGLLNVWRNWCYDSCKPYRGATRGCLVELKFDFSWRFGFWLMMETLVLEGTDLLTLLPLSDV